MDQILQEAASNAASMGPMILLQDMQIERPLDVVKATGLTVDDKRTVLAAWASDYYALDSTPAFRHISGTPRPVSIDELQAALRELGQRYGF
ncbi:conserved hypothetical protein [Agrobacterium fabacearum CFBP 5771]|uniref:hypothetical protein n=1 Tax=Agrobacterium tumefaciens TaxID=358 RepID=UPI0009B9FA68|nr:hypothetical protein [Agrobacterium tumefaciens]CVI24599.1 conserved hypothetical protein [Agrobacterium fabacearum CFBP 5771]